MVSPEIKEWLIDRWGNKKICEVNNIHIRKMIAPYTEKFDMWLNEYVFPDGTCFRAGVAGDIYIYLYKKKYPPVDFNINLYK
jgi:hypothetical protein